MKSELLFISPLDSSIWAVRPSGGSYINHEDTPLLALFHDGASAIGIFRHVGT